MNDSNAMHSNPGNLVIYNQLNAKEFDQEIFTWDKITEKQILEIFTWDQITWLDSFFSFLFSLKRYYTHKQLTSYCHI